MVLPSRAQVELSTLLSREKDAIEIVQSQKIWTRVIFELHMKIDEEGKEDRLLLLGGDNIVKEKENQNRRNSRHLFASRATTRPAGAHRARFFSEQPQSQSNSPSSRGKARGQDGPGGSGEPNGAGEGAGPERSAHAHWYTNTVPAMIPVALLGSAVYIGLQLLQTKLATEKYLDEANKRIKQLETELQELQQEQELRSNSSQLVKSADSVSRWWWR
ncbi:hypothetical protein DFH11DRAFT_1775017 [Phellopilus nigrolimitatus]|nr:hypothetical protein DFH11DRAFT_1775017 [Phellopilus nigrolimitatus]